MRLEIGRIAAAHGIRGEVRVELWDPALSLDGRSLFLKGEEGAHRVRSLKPWKGGAIIALAGIDTRSDAERLQGRILESEGEEAPPLEEGRYYVHELAGCGVYDAAGTFLGTLAEVRPGPAQDLWIAHGPQGSYLIPAVRATVLAVDIARKRITVRGGGVLGPDAAR